jgi:hypothetical protein
MRSSEFTRRPKAARAFPFPFTLTARAENYLAGRPDLKDTIQRLQAYQEAGADVLYAPGLSRKEGIASAVRSVDRPVNVLMGLQGFRLSLAELAAIGDRRAARQRRQRSLARCSGRLSQRWPGDAGARNLYIRRRGCELSGSQRDVYGVRATNAMNMKR